MILRYPRLDLPPHGPLAAAVCAEATRPPGSSADVRAVAAALARTAQALRDTLAKLRAISTDDSSWSGAAAGSFRAAVKEPAKSHIDQVPERYDGYAHLLISYASTLDGAQASIDLLRARAEDALNAYRAAKASGAAADCAEQECRAAALKFQASYNEWVDAANRCINGLKSVDKHDKLHNPHGIHAAADVVSSAMGEPSSLSSVLALVSLPICPELAVVLLAISTGASMVKLGADATREAYGEDVNWKTFAFDALGSIPAVGSAKGVLAATRQARAVEGVGAKFGGAARAFGKHMGRHYRRLLVRDPAQALRELDDGGGIAASARHTSWPRTRETLRDTGKQELLGDPLSAANDAWENRDRGWGRATVGGLVHVTWRPVEVAVRDVRDLVPPVANVGQVR
ncbi:MAG TPA: hypothetical protein VEL02_00680 [Jatrophihabitantaceae bacterium]|nr:hypothetical protein [Jatrophihabitantaceae bacterium]